MATQAQNLNYTIAGASNIAGSYTDLGTTGTAIPVANTDDANSAAQAIGFTFNYNGTGFTQFILNTNGFIKLGTAAPSAAAMYIDETFPSSVIDPFQSPADPNIIAAFNIDLVAGVAGGTEYRVATTGTAGARVCTIQWKNVKDKANVNPTQYSNLSFQVRLYERTNIIETVYSAATVGAPSALRFTQVGLKGTNFTDGQIVQVVKQSGTPWSAATFADFTKVRADTTLNTLNIRSVASPDAGRTFRFTPVTQIANDIAVRAVYTLGKIATPGALPQPVQAHVANLGTAAQSSVTVTLTVSGANTFTDTKTVTLPAGGRSMVTFAPLPATLNLGTDTVRVSVPTDGNNANNSVSVLQLVTTNRLSYIEPSKPYDGALGYSETPGAVLSVKYTVPSTVLLSSAFISFAEDSANTASYRVVVYDATGSGGLPGKALYTSPTQRRTEAGGDVTVPLPSLQLTGSFHIGVMEMDSLGSGIATQSENPLRAATFLYSDNGSAPWGDLAATTLQVRLAIEAGLAPAPGCAAPTGLTVTGTTSTTAIIAFTDPGSVGSYQIIYGPTGFQPATGGTTVTATSLPFTITGLQSGTNYQVYVRTNCTGGGTSLLVGPVGFSTSCDAAAAVTTFPYSENFDNILTGQALPCGITVLDANNDKATWAVSKVNPNSGTSSIRYNGLTLNDVAANDWFFTPGLTLAATSRYQLSFRYRGEGIANSPSSYTESLEVKSGAAPTVEGQTNLLYSNSAITNTSYQLANNISTPVVALLPAGAGTQYIGFHVNSPANQGVLYIDDITVSVVSATATSAALLRAVSVFPNPSTTGVFDLEIHGANAKGPLDVLVTNALGQRVYVGPARDNYTNKLDLSSLAAGIYHLQVRNGSEQLSRQLSIVK